MKRKVIRYFEKPYKGSPVMIGTFTGRKFLLRVTSESLQEIGQLRIGKEFIDKEDGLTYYLLEQPITVYTEFDFMDATDCKIVRRLI